MSKVNIALEIERLLNFGLKHNILEKFDVIPTRNALMDLLKVNEPYDKNLAEENIEYPSEILKNILDYANEIGLISENTTTYRDLMDAKIMGLLMPRQSEVVRRFFNTAKEHGIERATDDYYALSKASNYIMMDRIDKNLYWETPTEYGSLEITINLSKPEKDPKEIAASRLRPQSNYPKCLLCIENVGFAGHISHPARQNHRVIPVSLSKEQWYLQYSPYVYYNEHCILFKGEHVPMKLTNKTFERLFGFIEEFPHYFIGTNADLPIVGGSILSHDHFQGGHHIFPMEKAEIEREFASKTYKDIKIGIVKWPMSVIRLSGKNKEALIELSKEVLDTWRNYSDEEVNILSHTILGDEKTPHNTVTPIARKNKKGDFEIDLVLRNNRTTDEYPDGIFHPHKELHHIKKENIGLIEVMGLAVLPARLSTELKAIENILKGDNSIYEEAKNNKESSINKHISWIDELIKKYGTKCSDIKAKRYVKEEVGNKFMQVLLDSGVYKRDELGEKGINKFMKSLGFSAL